MILLWMVEFFFWMPEAWGLTWSVAPESGYQTALTVLFCFWPWRGRNLDFFSTTVGNLDSLLQLKHAITECPFFKQIWQTTVSLWTTLVIEIIPVAGDRTNLSSCDHSMLWNSVKETSSAHADCAVKNDCYDESNLFKPINVSSPSSKAAPTSRTSSASQVNSAR